MDVHASTARLEGDDNHFLSWWGNLDIEERAAFPEEVQREARERYKALTPHIAASVKRAERSTAALTMAQDALSAKATPIPGYSIAAIWEGYSPAAYLLKRIIEAGAVTVLFGQSGHLKSVLAVNIAMCIGTETEFHGMRVKRAGVLYVAGEGHGGIKKRIRAWLIDHGHDSTSPLPPIYVTTEGADLIGDPERLRVTAEHAASQLGVPIGLVIIDTLAANFGIGDENHANEMQLAITGARAASPGAAVLLVHHSGHGDADRERGSSALRATADFRFKATYTKHMKVLELTCEKVKDDEELKPLIFEPRKVPIDWQDEDGEELTSVVLDRLPDDTPRAPDVDGLGKNQETGLKSLRTLLAKVRKNLLERGDDPATACILISGWRADLEKHGVGRTRYYEVQNDLQRRGLIVIDGPHVHLAEGAP